MPDYQHLERIARAHLARLDELGEGATVSCSELLTGIYAEGLLAGAYDDPTDGENTPGPSRDP
jgi:hypothetical protein